MAAYLSNELGVRGPTCGLIGLGAQADLCSCTCTYMHTCFFISLFVLLLETVKEIYMHTCFFISLSDASVDIERRGETNKNYRE